MKNWKLWLVVGVFVVGGVAVFDWTRWWVLDVRVQSRVVTPISKEPTTRDVVRLRERIREEARGLWISPETVAIDMHCEQHLSNGYALKEDQLKIHWFLMIEARCRGRTAKWEQRLDNALPDFDAQGLEAAGVPILRKSAQGG